MALPTGIVALLFTDVEGSTRHVQELGDDYPAVMAEHRRLIRDAVEGRGGHEVDARGDETFAVFASTRDAVHAAADAQRALAVSPLRVRIGIHTGEPTQAEGGYVGLDVNRAARICTAGHGGQVLVSQSAHDLVAPLGEAEFRDLGEHELRGLPRPERIYQLVAEGLEGDFAALRTDTADAPFEAHTRVVLAEDSVLLREGIARLLADAGFDVVGQSSNADDLLLKVRSYSPDVVITDIRMPPTQTDEGLRAAQQIRTDHPGVGVLVLSQYVEPGYAMELLADSAEGVGYLLKDRVADVEEFVAAVRRVAEGGSALDPALVTQLVGRRRREDPLDALTPREREVLELMAEGRSNQGIAQRLVVTERAVEKHVTSIFTKLRLPPATEDHRRVLAVLAFLRG
ncbi:MAG TPA: response regulator [Gaiellaceae bacterium]|nr:response regulator [Gaiellaceae bacterium]